MPVSENNTQEVYTVGDWLFGCVNFSIPQETVKHICVSRNVDMQTEYSDMATDGKPNSELLLLKADLLKWILLGPGKVNNTSDEDNGWSHSDGGYTLSKDDKKLLMNEANAIYEEFEPESVFGKKRIRVHSLGVMPAKLDVDGNPLPRIVR